jgi:hypothetical protein
MKYRGCINDDDHGFVYAEERSWKYPSTYGYAAIDPVSLTMLMILFISILINLIIRSFQCEFVSSKKYSSSCSFLVLHLKMRQCCSVSLKSKISCNWTEQLARTVYFTLHYIDNVLSLINSKLGDIVDCIYPIELEIEYTTQTLLECFYIEMGKLK